MSNIGYYIFALIVLIVGFIIVKKVTTCMIKAVVGGIVIAVLVAVYFLYFR
jgi:hypothetical protein